jgi:hypothetical protein
MRALGEAVYVRLYVGEYVRRSLTVTPENDKNLLLTKGRFLTGDAPLDIDYTTMVNIFIELGHKLISVAWADNTDPEVVINKSEIIESFKKHAFSSELKEESVGDQVAEIIFKKLTAQAGIPSQMPNQQDQIQLPEGPKAKAKEKTNKKYII